MGSLVPLFICTHHRRFHETLKYKKPMNVYFESLKINEEITDKFEKGVA